MKFMIDEEQLQLLLKDFYTLTKIRIVVFDEQFVEIAAYPNHHSTFCRLLRQDEKALEKCSRCDREACEKSRKYKKTVMYRCYAGLTEAVTPISYGGMVVGYIMFGQVLNTEDKDALWQSVLPELGAFELPLDKLKAYFYQKKNLTEELLSATASILQACAGYLYLSKVVSVQQEDVESKLERYISEHLSDDLSVLVLCDACDISKTHLYEISQYCYGEPIAEHIRKLRISKAKELLVGTNKQIGEIAVECGILDYNYFIKVFKRYAGKTPRAYRKAKRAALIK